MPCRARQYLCHQKHYPIDYSDRVVAEIVEEHVSVVISLWPASDRQLQFIRNKTLKDPQLDALLKILQLQWPETKAALAVEVQGFLGQSTSFQPSRWVDLTGNSNRDPKDDAYRAVNTRSRGTSWNCKDQGSNSRALVVAEYEQSLDTIAC